MNKFNLATLIALALLLGPLANNAAAQTIYDESIDGDLSSNQSPGNATNLGLLGAGNHTILLNDSGGVFDRDHFTFEVASGNQLTSFLLDDFTSSFFGFASITLGTGQDPFVGSTVEFINWTGTPLDLLQFDSAPGAQSAGDYVTSVSYSDSGIRDYSFSITAVVEPANNIFSIVIIPDTQLYVEDHPEIFEAQIDWIIANQAAENIIYVSHLGDLKDTQTCDNPTVTNGSGDGRTEWQIVDQTFDRLDAANIPYGVVPGNHDFDSINPGTASERCPNWTGERPLGLYNNVNNFAPSRFAADPWYGDLTGTGERGNRVDDSNEDNFTLFEGTCGVQFVAVNLAYKELANAVGDGSEVDWADDLLKLYPNRLGIVTSHNFLRQNPDIGTCTPGTPGCRFNSLGGTYGQEVYEGLTDPVKGDNPNLLMMLSAHKRGEAWRQGTLRRTGLQPLHVLLSDYQSVNYPADPSSVDFGNLDGTSSNNGNGGFMRIMRFDPETQMVNVETFAPAVSFLDDDDNPYTYDFRPSPPAERPSDLVSDYFPADGLQMDKDTASNFSFSFDGYLTADPVCP
jgi:hypothetical protein